MAMKTRARSHEETSKQIQIHGTYFTGDRIHNFKFRNDSRNCLCEKEKCRECITGPGNLIFMKTATGSLSDCI